MSRAAVFVASAACSSNAPTPQRVAPPPPTDAPVEQTTTTATVDAGAPTSTTGDAAEQTPVTGSGSIEGYVRAGRGPGSSVEVHIAGPVRQQIKTDAGGKFVFTDLPPGTYAVTIGPARKNDAREVAVSAGQTAHIDLYLPVPVDRTNMAKPYGAPPARRRTV